MLARLLALTNCVVCPIQTRRLRVSADTNRTSDTEKDSHNLDLKYHRSVFTKVLKSHGKDSSYLVLAIGPFTNIFFPVDLMALSACALKAIYSWNTSPKHVLATNLGGSFWSLGFFDVG